MLRLVSYAFLFVLGVLHFNSEAYTVILKNGRVLTGTLISETEEAILFKDDKGIQYSLKKTAVDLEKMMAANAVTPSETPLQETEIAPPPARKPTSTKGRTYTKEDIENLRAKYGELTTGEPIEDLEDYDERGNIRPEAYLKRLKGSTDQLTTAVQNLTTLGNGVATAWEVAESTGQTAAEAISGYTSAETTIALMNTSTSEIRTLESLRDRLGRQIPTGYNDGYQILSQAVEAITTYQSLLRQPSAVENATVFRSRLQELENSINSNVSRLQGFQPPPPPKSEKKPATAPPAERVTPEQERTETAPEEEPPAEEPPQ